MAGIALRGVGGTAGESPGQRPAKQVHLMEAAFAPSYPVQRHWHNHVRRESFGLGLNYFASRPAKQRLDLFMLEQSNCARKGFFVETVAAHRPEREALVLAIAAHRFGLREFGVKRAWQSADVATPGCYPFKRREAIERNPACIRKGFFAQPAIRQEANATLALT